MKYQYSLHNPIDKPDDYCMRITGWLFGEKYVHLIWMTEDMYTDMLDNPDFARRFAEHNYKKQRRSILLQWYRPLIIKFKKRFGLYSIDEDEDS